MAAGSFGKPPQPVDSRAYLAELMNEREKLSGHAARLVDQEIQRVHGQNGSSARSSHAWIPPGPLMDIHKGRSVRLQVRVQVPVKDHPNFNFVGKLLGPKGNSLKRLQEETQTKMAILGRGSMRDKAKEEDLRQLKDPKYWHLHEELHVEVNAFAPPAEAYRRMAFALAQLKPFLVPDYYDEIRQTQLRELALLKNDRKNGATTAASLESSSPQTSLAPSAPPGTASPPCGNELVAVSSCGSNATAQHAQLRSSWHPLVTGHVQASLHQDASSSSCRSSPPTPPTHPALRPGVPAGLVLAGNPDALSQLPPIQVSSGLARGVAPPPTTAAAVSAAAAKAAYLLHGSRVLPVRLTRKSALRAAALTLGRAAAVGALRHGAAVELISTDCAADEFLYGDEYPDGNFDGNVYEQAFTTIDEQGFSHQSPEDMPSNGYAADTDFAEWADPPLRTHCHLPTRLKASQGMTRRLYRPYGPLPSRF
ncbi:KH domain-containing RNA-binding protein qki.S-like isoform X5 [Amblyomma americanum]